MVTNAKSPGAKCYGFVTMATTEEASKCIQHLHRTELHGKMISVERVSTPTSFPPSPLYMISVERVSTPLSFPPTSISLERVGTLSFLLLAHLPPLHGNKLHGQMVSIERVSIPRQLE